MKLHPNARAAIRWGLSVLGVVLCAAWISSRWYLSWWVTGLGINVNFGNGVLVFSTGTDQFGPRPPGFAVRYQTYFEWWFDAGRSFQYRYVAIPLWVLVVPCVAAAVVAKARIVRIDATRRRSGLQSQKKVS